MLKRSRESRDVDTPHDDSAGPLSLTPTAPSSSPSTGRGSGTCIKNAPNKAGGREHPPISPFPCPVPLTARPDVHNSNASSWCSVRELALLLPLSVAAGPGELLIPRVMIPSLGTTPCSSRKLEDPAAIFVGSPEGVGCWERPGDFLRFILRNRSIWVAEEKR